MISLINSGCSSVIAFVQEVAKLAILTNRQSTAPHKYASDKEPYVSEIYIMKENLFQIRVRYLQYEECSETEMRN